MSFFVCLFAALLGSVALGLGVVLSGATTLALSVFAAFEVTVVLDVVVLIGRAALLAFLLAAFDILLAPVFAPLLAPRDTLPTAFAAFVLACAVALAFAALRTAFATLAAAFEAFLLLVLEPRVTLA